MDDKEAEERHARPLDHDDSTTKGLRRKEVAEKAMLVVKNALTFSSTMDQDDLTCGERVASFVVAADLARDDDAKPYSKEAFHPSKPILWTRGKYKSRNEKSLHSQPPIKQFYSDMVVRRTGNSFPSAKSEGDFGMSQRSIVQQSVEKKNSGISCQDGSCVKKKETSQKRCSENIDTSVDKDEKYQENYSFSDKKSTPRMKNDRENSFFEKKRFKDIKTANPEPRSHNKDPEVFHSKGTAPEKEKNNNFKSGKQRMTSMESVNLAESKKEAAPSFRPVEKECRVSETSSQRNEESHKSRKPKMAIAKDSNRMKSAKKLSSCGDKDELKSKSENHVSFGFTGRHPGRIPGTSSLIDIEKIKKKHSRCCQECIQARARSARPTKGLHHQEDAKAMTYHKGTAPKADTIDASSEDQLENSIVFFRNALNAVDLLEKLFQNIGSTKDFLQNIYDGLEESNDVARCRRNLAEARLEDEAVTQSKSNLERENEGKGTGGGHEEEIKKKKLKTKDNIKAKCRSNASSGQTKEKTSLKTEQKSKAKRDRDKNLLELSDEWKKRNVHGKSS